MGTAFFQTSPSASLCTWTTLTAITQMLLQKSEFPSAHWRPCLDPSARLLNDFFLYLQAQSCLGNSNTMGLVRKQIDRNVDTHTQRHHVLTWVRDGEEVQLSLLLKQKEKKNLMTETEVGAVIGGFK